MITSVIEMLELSNGMTSWIKNMTSEPCFENNFILRRPRVSIFANIMKVVTMFIIIFSDSKKLKELEIMHQNGICVCIS